jgi:hypothetical protein
MQFPSAYNNNKKLRRSVAAPLFRLAIAVAFGWGPLSVQAIAQTQAPSEAATSPLQLAPGAHDDSRPEPAQQAPARVPQQTPAPRPQHKPVAQAQAQPQQAAVSQSNAEVVVTLVRTTLVALHHANVTGNYTVLRDLAAPDFSEKNTASDLARIFAPIRDLHVDLGRVVLLDPQISQAMLTKEKMLDIAGALATEPPVKFELQFRPVAGVWRVEKISIAPLQVQPVPQAQAPAAAPPAPAKPPARHRAAKPNPTPPAPATPAPAAPK